MLLLIVFALLSSLVVSQLFHQSMIRRYRAQAATVPAVDRRHDGISRGEDVWARTAQGCFSRMED